MARVLIVDDHHDTSDAMARVLRKRHHSVTTVDNARSAMALLIGDTPDFAVFDHKMPGMTGLELVRAMRSYLRLKHLPVLMVTAYPEAPELRDLQDLDLIGVTPKVDLVLSEVADLVDLHARLNPREN